MKKILSILLVAVMTFGLFACGQKQATAPETQAQVAEVQTEVATEAPAKLIMCTNAEFPPYEYIDNGQYVGIDVECAKAIAADMGMELEVMDVAFDAIIPAIMGDKADFAMAGMTVTEDRKQNVDFSNTYQNATQNVIVADGGSIASVDDLFGKKIGVVSGFTGDMYATDDFGEENIERFKNGLDAVQALKAGKIDCVIVDDEVAKNYVKSNEGLKVLETSYVEEEYAACVKKGNTELLAQINESIAKLKSSGEFDKIVAKYIKD